MCKTLLAEITEIGKSSIIGEAAHIVAQSVDGPRGGEPLNLALRDQYSNLILLCPTDHSRIDDLPNGPLEYPVERLVEIKAEHECEMLKLGRVDTVKQLHEEQWANLIDQLQHVLFWDSWRRQLGLLAHGYGQRVHLVTLEALEGASEWIFTRAWPPGNDELRETIRTLGRVLTDLTETFSMHSKEIDGQSGIVETEKFYKIREWDTALYESLLDEYKQHVNIVDELVWLATRYSNLVARKVRASVDPSFRFQEGVVSVQRVDVASWDSLRHEFTDTELEGTPYPGPEEFRDRLFGVVE